MKAVIILLTILFFISCSGIEMKRTFFNNSIFIEVEFNEVYESFENGVVEIVILKKENEKNEVISKEKVNSLVHNKGKKTIRRYIINTKENLKNEFEYYIYLKVYKNFYDEKYMELIYDGDFKDNERRISELIKEVRFIIK